MDLETGGRAIRLHYLASLIAKKAQRRNSHRFELMATTRKNHVHKLRQWMSSDGYKIFPEILAG
jgi:hypothetical protein